MRVSNELSLAYVDAEQIMYANAVRGFLEYFGYRVDAVRAGVPANLSAILNGTIQTCETIIFASHGLIDKETGEVKQLFNFTHEKIPVGYFEINLQGKTVFNMGCHLGNEKIAKQFLDSGVDTYIGATKFIDQRIGLWFLLDIFASLSVGRNLDESFRQSADKHAEFGEFAIYSNGKPEEWRLPAYRTIEITEQGDLGDGRLAAPDL